MPRDIVTSDADADAPRAKQKEYSSKKKRVPSPEPGRASESEEAPEGEGGEEEEEEEEFEIEEVLDSQKGYFADGKFGYFVKWKGYEAEDNSWVHEDDAVNAKDLINKYWDNKRKASKGGPRKSDASKAKSGHKSSTVNDTRESSLPPAKKRSRPKKDEPEQSEKEQEASDDDARAKKKPRKSQGTSAKKSKKQLADDEEEITVGSMKKHMTIASWETLVDTIDTIERGDDGKLYVYFKIKNRDERMRELSQVCAEKFPQKLIKFYESNLRWRIEGDDAN